MQFRQMRVVLLLRFLPHLLWATPRYGLLISPFMVRTTDVPLSNTEQYQITMRNGILKVGTQKKLAVMGSVLTKHYVPGLIAVMHDGAEGLLFLKSQRK